MCFCVEVEKKSGRNPNVCAKILPFNQDLTAVQTDHFYLSSANQPTPGAWAGPPKGLLLLLLAVVVLAHGLALKSIWSGSIRFGAAYSAQNGAALLQQPLQVRRIESPSPAIAAVTPAQVAGQPDAPKSAEKADFYKPNKPPAQQTPARAAINSVATESAPAIAENPDEGEIAPYESVPSKPQQALASADSTTSMAPALVDTPSSNALDAGAQPPATTVVTAMALPASARLDYKVEGQARGLNYHATATLDWKSDGAVYEARMTVLAFLIGKRSMQSLGTVSARGLAPQKFTDVYRSEQAAHFEADKGLITFSANTPSKPWLPGAQDRVSVFMQLAGMLAGSPPVTGAPPTQLQAPGALITLYTAGPRDADTWSFAIEALDTLDLPYGQVNAWHLVRQPRREYDQKVEIWYAPSLGFLPVRSRITQANGDFVDQRLSKVALAAGP